MFFTVAIAIMFSPSDTPSAILMTVTFMQVPTEEFFAKDMGLALEMTPNYEDFSCQVCAYSYWNMISMRQAEIAHLCPITVMNVGDVVQKLVVMQTRWTGFWIELETLHVFSCVSFLPVCYVHFTWLTPPPPPCVFRPYYRMLFLH